VIVVFGKLSEAMPSHEPAASTATIARKLPEEVEKNAQMKPATMRLIQALVILLLVQ
jgi:hypothetical protein